MARPGARGRCRGVVLAGLLGVGLVSGCATVEPWDRGALLKPHMAVDPWPSRCASRQQVVCARLAAPAAKAADGGACGCY